MIRKIWDDLFVLVSDRIDVFKDNNDTIVDMLINDEIDPAIFSENLGFVLKEKSDLPPVKSASKSFLNPPKKREYFMLLHNKPPSIPLWFMCAYPDVMLWLDEQQSKNILNSEDYIIYLLKVFEVKEGVTNIVDAKGMVKTEYLKNLTRKYREDTKLVFETSEPNMESNIYIAEKFFKRFGTENNITLVAENTTKIYLELFKNYRLVLDNETALFAFAGVIDALVYVNNKTIKPRDIIAIARMALSKEKDQYLEFITQLEIKLFSIDNVNVPYDKVKETCESQKNNIRAAIQNILMTYQTEANWSTLVFDFMNNRDYKYLIDLLKHKTSYPRTMKAAVNRLLEEMSEDAKYRLKFSGKNDLVKYHFGLGMYIRNEFNLWHKNNDLLLECGGTEMHPDEASIVIIESLWKELQLIDVINPLVEYNSSIEPPNIFYKVEPALVENGIVFKGEVSSSHHQVGYYLSLDRAIKAAKRMTDTDYELMSDHKTYSEWLANAVVGRVYGPAGNLEYVDYDDAKKRY